jgi:diguanylate cyclase (GGDEF)-like protein
VAGRGAVAGYLDGRSADTAYDHEELIYESQRTRVTRLSNGIGSVVRKELLGPGAVQRVRHEVAILGRLAGATGVSQLAPVPAQPTVLWLADARGSAMAEQLGSLRRRIPAVLGAGLDLAMIVAEIHRRGVIHKDINPANMLVSDSGAVTLIDFDLATTFAEERPDFAHQTEITGTLAYLAPEQSGRTGRPVDQRADLYALGATLYALATGNPVFGEGDSLQLIHDHLARVPTPPIAVNPEVPEDLSDIILRLLEKEPDRRYQSAEGLAYDLAEVSARRVSGDHTPLRLGARDFPLRLVAPSRLVGRDPEIEELRTCFDRAVQGGARGVLVTGPPGVGKTALIDELRPIVTAAGGWFIAGKFDQYGHDSTSDGVTQAMRRLAGLLLAEPEAALVALRSRLRADLGANIRLLTRLVPEFAVIVGEPDVSADDATGDPADLERRMVQVGLALLRAVVSPERPLALIIDDLQWATSAPIGFVDAILTADDLSGLLLVGAYREAEVDEAHPLSAMLARWERLGAVPPPTRLVNLPPAGLVALLAGILRLPDSEAGDLAAAVGERTAGNPYDTVELVNALRRDGALVAGEGSWQWDPATLRRYVGTGDVVDLLAARIDRLPPPVQSVLEIMACLGGDLDLDLLRTAAGLPAAEMQDRLVVALEDGLLVGGQASVDLGGTVRFRHDRVMQAAHSRLTVPERQALHLDLARRLAASSGYAMAAAGQYLPAVGILSDPDRLSDPDECGRVAGLFRSAAATIGMTNYVAAERFLAAATDLLDAAGRAPDDPLGFALDVERHTALYRLGRQADADELFLRIQRRQPDPRILVAPTCVQISSITDRGRPGDAVALGMQLLDRLGLAAPSPERIGAEADRGLTAMIAWVEACDLATDLRRPDISDPEVLAVARVINSIMSAAVFGAPELLPWLVTVVWRLWAEHGPSALLLAPFAQSCTVLNKLRDYRAGRAPVHHMLEFGEARQYEPETSRVRFLFAIGSGQWFGPLEDNIALAQFARERLIHNGDPHFAGLTYGITLPQLLDCAPTLESYAVVVDAGIAYATRTGSEFICAFAMIYRQVARSLRGETDQPGGFDEASFAEAGYVAAAAAQPLVGAYFHTARALTAAIFGNVTDLATHAAAAMPLLPATYGGYPTAWGYLFRSMALAQVVKTGPPDDRPAALAELEDRHRWLVERAADAPGNFRHLSLLVVAERAWATGEYWAATQAFDAALLEARKHGRPWHRALIAERAGVFCREQGLRDNSRRLLSEAHRCYQAWGATAKVAQMRQRYGTPHPADPSSTATGSSTGSTIVGSGTIDLLAILQASQALSSETDLDRLRRSVVEVLGAMTGATTVRILLWNEDLHGWFLTPDGDAAGPPIAVDDAGRQGLVPLTAFRYVERTRAPLLVEDATHDDRFARDPYLAGLDRCSLLVVPIEVQHQPRAVLILENRLGSGAFSAERLDAVMLIAGQLAVSFDNAMVYASLAQKVAERTEALAVTNRRLEMLSATDPLTGLANRRQLEQVLDTEWARLEAREQPLAVAMIDIDHFKTYNDHYGHQLGDRCLQRIAAALVSTVRDTDLTARYGGEEFILVLPGADLETAYRIGRRAGEAVAALREEHVGSPFGIVTVSIGVAATVPSPQSTHTELVRTADAKLYEAKHNGRNQVGGGPAD